MYLHLRSPLYLPPRNADLYLPLWRIYHHGKYIGEMRARFSDTALTEYANRTGLSYWDLEAIEIDE